MSAIFKREFKAFFSSPIGYLVIAIMFVLSGYYFYVANLELGNLSLSYVFTALFSYAGFLVLPILTMRLFSEEKKQKTDQALLTAPVNLTEIVLGKFLAAFLIYVIGISITLVYGCVIASVTAPAWLTIFSSYLGLMLYGGMIIAAGLFFSCLTESQLIAALLTFAFELFLTFFDYLATLFADHQWIVTCVKFVSVTDRYTGFTAGSMHYDDILFFLTMQALFLFFAVRILDRKRWN